MSGESKRRIMGCHHSAPCARTAKKKVESPERRKSRDESREPDKKKVESRETDKRRRSRTRLAADFFDCWLSTLDPPPSTFSMLVLDSPLSTLSLPYPSQGLAWYHNRKSRVQREESR